MSTCTTGGASGGLAGAYLKIPKSEHRQTSANIPIASHTEILTLPRDPARHALGPPLKIVFIDFDGVLHATVGKPAAMRQFVWLPILLELLSDQSDLGDRYSRIGASGQPCRIPHAAIGIDSTAVQRRHGANFGSLALDSTLDFHASRHFKFSNSGRYGF